MPKEYFFVSALKAKRGNDVWYSRVFPIDYTDENNLDDQQKALQAQFTDYIHLPQPNNTPWSNGFASFQDACDERKSDLVKPGTIVHTPAWPADAPDCAKQRKRK